MEGRGEVRGQAHEVGLEITADLAVQETKVLPAEQESCAKPAEQGATVE